MSVAENELSSMTRQSRTLSPTTNRQEPEHVAHVGDFYLYIYRRIPNAAVHWPSVSEIRLKPGQPLNALLADGLCTIYPYFVWYEPPLKPEISS